MKSEKEQSERTPYTHRYSLTAADMDTRYRMTPGAVLLYYQDCWARYMACLHLASFDVVKMHRMWVITEFSAWFEEQTALWSDDIDVTVWNSEIGALRLYAEFRVHRTDGVEVAHGYGCWTLLDTEAHRLATLEPIQAQVPILPEMTSDTHKKRRFPAEGTPLQQIEHRVNPINLDFNGHVNNRTYLSIAMQSADEEFMDAYAIRCLSIHWLKETFLGDRLLSRLTLLPHETEETTYHYLNTISRNDTEPAAQVYSEWVPRTMQVDVSVHAQRV
ncbi:MAG: hypothetical protein K6A36_01900 [Paludibacteraceae bacterium]|nr:hypothetical protein [Paludibacteraceae bacterium]